MGEGVGAQQVTRRRFGGWPQGAPSGRVPRKEQPVLHLVVGWRKDLMRPSVEEQGQIGGRHHYLGGS